MTLQPSRPVLGSNAWHGIAALTLLLAVLLVAWIAQSAFEANAYERVTGKVVSTWDAMFLDLRVQEGVSR